MDDISYDFASATPKWDAGRTPTHFSSHFVIRTQATSPWTASTAKAKSGSATAAAEGSEPADRAEAAPFWQADRSTLGSLFERIINHLRQTTAEPEDEATERTRRKLWHLLGRLHFIGGRTFQRSGASPPGTRSSRRRTAHCCHRPIPCCTCRSWIRETEPGGPSCVK